MNNNILRKLWYTIDDQGNLKVTVGNICFATVEDCKDKSSAEIAEIVDKVLTEKKSSIELADKLFG